MGMTERFLILGTTGVVKNDVISNLRKYAQSQSVPVDFVSVDFEKDYILGKTPRLKMHSYLDAGKDRQRGYWQTGWESLMLECQAKNIILSLHGVLTRLTTGTRSPINLHSLFEFSPTRIVTLIDDVYVKWYRTETRAVDAPYKGTPTLEQLLDARRAEIFLGELIATNINPQALYYVLAVRHPARTLYRLLFVPHQELTTVYLSFPISGPRKLLSENDDSSGIFEVNEFLKKANDFESKNPKVACFCPLCIDEYPLLWAPEEKKQGKKYKVFRMKDRWNIRKFYGDEILLTVDSNLPAKIEMPSKQVDHAEGFIRRDVALRDYRLVTQADRLAVFNPWFNGRETKGVRNEIRFAIRNNIPCHIYQDPKHDSNGEAREKLNPPLSSLGDEPYSEYIKFHDSVDDLFKRII